MSAGRTILILPGFKRVSHATVPERPSDATEMAMLTGSRLMSREARLPAAHSRGVHYFYHLFFLFRRRAESDSRKACAPRHAARLRDCYAFPVCIICVEFEKGRMTAKEARRALGEMVPKVGARDAESLGSVVRGGVV
jgi:hypothetical protein